MANVVVEVNGKKYEYVTWLRTKKDGTKSNTYRFSSDNKWIMLRENNYVYPRISGTEEPDLNASPMGYCMRCFEIVPLSHIIEVRDNGVLETICEKCHAKEFFVCPTCGKSCDSESQVTGMDNEIMCQSCFDNKYKKCADCGNIELKENALKYNGAFYCKECQETRFVTCTDCGKLIHKNDARILTNEVDTYYCRNCWELKKPIKPYNFIPSKINFLKLPTENTELFFGFELEVEPIKGRRDDNGEYTEDAIKVTNFLKANNLDKYFYIKHDGSVEGFELVTHPFTMSFLHSNMKIYELCEFLKKKRFTSYSSGNCGFHVHMSKKFFTPEDIIKFHCFFKSNARKIRDFSKRISPEGTDSENREEIDKLVRFCSFDTLQRTDIKEFLNGYTITDHHIGINVSAKSTLEVRIFRGTLFYPRIIASLKFCEALAFFIKEHSVQTFTKDCWNEFLTYCKSRGCYQDFIEYLDKFADTKEKHLLY